MTNRLPALDEIRGFAALAVVGLHYFIVPLDPAGLGPLAQLAWLYASQAWVAVPVFFCLSGFLILRQLEVMDVPVLHDVCIRRGPVGPTITRPRVGCVLDSTQRRQGGDGHLGKALVEAFHRRRFARIVPLWVAVGVGCWLTLGTGDLPWWGWLCPQFWQAAGVVPPEPIGPLWSVSLEAGFYLVAPWVKR